MIQHLGRLGALAGLVLVAPMATMVEAQPAAQQAPQQAASPWTPAKVLIYREEVKPGHGAAHAANEAEWSAAFRKANAPSYWVGMTTMMGPSEAWFLSAFDSYAAYQKVQDAMDAVPALRAADDRFSSQEGDHLSRTSAIMAGFRPGLSYQPSVDLPKMRFMQVDVVRVKPGHDREFRMMWRAMVEAHTKAKMDEHWAVYEVEAGAQDLTFFFFYAKGSLAGIDAAGPMHGSDAFRDAVGEGGRIQMREGTQAAIESSMTYVFQMRPGMSTVPKEWLDADPTFWTVKAPEPSAIAATKKK